LTKWAPPKKGPTSAATDLRTKTTRPRQGNPARFFFGAAM
jgi:hypothetical protein